MTDNPFRERVTGPPEAACTGDGRVGVGAPDRAEVRELLTVWPGG